MCLINIAMRGLPHSFRDVPASPQETVEIDITGASGGQWTLVRDEQRWTLWCGQLSSADARVQLNADTAWKLLFNALSADDAEPAIRIEGRLELGRAILRARSVIV